MSFKKGMYAEFQLRKILENMGFEVWHLRCFGDLIAKKDLITYGIEVKVVYIAKDDQKRIYLKKESINTFLYKCNIFDVFPLFALRDGEHWFIYDARKFKPLKRNTTTTPNHLSLIKLERFFFE
jgi:Holliday junction resolvase